MISDPRSVPAAHSMDTAWFGVDADGNLALFDTGEAGAFPEDAVGSNNGARPLGGHHDGFDAICAALGVDDEAVYEPELELPVYRYEHCEQFYIADRYERASSPERPRRIEDVPPELRPGVVKLPVRFAAGDPVQPVEHVPTVGWSAIWRSVDGTVVRPFPAQERAEEEWQDLVDEGETEGVRFEPDPGPARTRGVNAPEREPDPPAPPKPRADLTNATPDQMRSALGLPPKPPPQAPKAEPGPTPEAPKKPWWKFW